jgi:heat shock protein HtpX
MTTASLISSNIRKTWMMMTVFFAVVAGIGWVMTQYTGNPSFLYTGIILSIGMNLFAYWKSDVMAIRSSGAVPADPRHYPQLHALIQKLSAQARVPVPRVYIINDPAPNAFATGRNPANAAVAATTGLLEMMDERELEGVLAHEMSHVVNRDILVSTVAVVLVGVISMFADMFIRASALGGDRGRSPLVAILGFVGIIVAPLAANLMHLAISRRRELLADASGAELTKEPEGLASALMKIASYKAPMRRASTATAHLFIANPFGGSKVAGFFANMFSTHPPVEQRVALLRGIRE